MSTMTASPSGPPVSERVPPHNLEAEQSTLGSMLIDREAIARAHEALSTDDFYREAHRLIFEAITALYERGEPVDIVTVAEVLRHRDALERSGGLSYLTTLANSVPTSANVGYYARIVKDKALLRSLILAGTQIAAMGYDGSEDIEATLDEAEQLVFNIAQKKGIGGLVGIKTVLLNTFERIEKNSASKGGVTGVPTGFTDFDGMLSGLQPSDLVIVAGRPSMGKTSLALNIGLHAAISEDIPVAIFSLEMSKEQLAMKLLSSEARIEGQRLRRGDLRDEEWKRLSEAMGRLSEAPVFIDDSATMTALDIRARARRLKAAGNLGLVIVDYLQLVHGRGRAENRQQEIAEITRSLKALARELNIPVLALAQLSRAVDATSERRPLLSHLKESGEIETSSDVVAFIYRDEYYNPKTERKNIAEIIIAKQRNGPTGTVELLWRREFTRFENIEKRRQA